MARWVEDRQAGYQMTAQKRYPERWGMVKPKDTIAVCACGAHFQLGELHLIEKHITEKSPPAHKWVFVADIILEYDPEGEDE